MLDLFRTPSDHPFPVQNLPWGVFSAGDEGPRAGVRIADSVLDLAAIAGRGLIAVPGFDARAAFGAPTLNAFMASGAATWSAVRRRIEALVSGESPELTVDPDLRSRAVHPAGGVRMHLPAAIGDYTDFYSSREHATNVGIMLRGAENALPPSWLHLPIGYHGRASSVVVDGTPVRRPMGQTRPDGADPVFGPSQLLDFELEMGFFVGPGNELGVPVPLARAQEQVFGFVLVNDWSARDIQKWEYVPLGPFLGKSFATTVSPWIVPLEALLPMRVPGPARDPTPLPYLRDPEPWSFDVHLEVGIRPAGRERPTTVCRSNLKHLYWNVRQQIAHHTSGGCNLRPGDLLASGTISGPDPGSFGSLLEITWRGARSVDLGDGMTRRFLEDGDTVVLSGWAQGEGYRIGFGEATGTVVPNDETHDNE
jgi:fumarylacetoacetase